MKKIVAAVLLVGLWCGTSNGDVWEKVQDMRRERLTKQLSAQDRESREHAAWLIGGGVAIAGGLIGAGLWCLSRGRRARPASHQPE